MALNPDYYQSISVKNYYWDVLLLSWVVGTQPGGGGGGGDASAANQVLQLAQATAAAVSLASVDTKTPALVTGRVPVDGSGVTQPVSGTFFQATQPVSLAVAPTTPVTGTFWPVTQPISAAALPLPSGAATEATLDTRTGALTETPPATDTASSGLNGRLQRVAQRLTSMIALLPVALGAGGGLKVDGSGTALPVSGTFFQVTQPVSGSFFQATQPVSIASMPSTPVTGTFWQATQPVSGTFWQATQPVSGTVTVTPPTLTKGTQGATGFSVQDLKDAGRNVTNIFMAAPIITTVAEVMQSFVAYKSGAAVGATATPAVVTAGKTYRVNSIEITYWAATVIGGALVRMRVLTSGVALIGSPLFKTFQVGIPAVFTAGAGMTYVFPYPEGIEFAAGTGIAFGVQGVGADGTTGTITGKIMIVMNGYEY